MGKYFIFSLLPLLVLAGCSKVPFGNKSPQGDSKPSLPSFGSEYNLTLSSGRVAIDADDIILYSICNYTPQILYLFDGVKIESKKCITTSKASKYNLYRVMLNYKYYLKWKISYTPAQIKIIIMKANLKKRKRKAN